MKRLVVLALLAVCSVTHYWPLNRTRLACRPSYWSAVLDERWNTGIWKYPDISVKAFLR